MCIKLLGGRSLSPGGAAGGAQRHLECKMCKKEGAAGLRQSRKRWQAFFQRHAVHHISRCSMPYTLRHFLASPRGRLRAEGTSHEEGGHTRARGDRVGHDGDGSPGHGRWLGRWWGGDSGGHRWRPRRGPAALEGEDTAPVRQSDEGAQQPRLHPCPRCTPVPLTWYAWSVWTWQRPGGAGGLQGEARARSRIGSAGGGGASGPGKAGGTEEVGETGVRLESPSVSASTSTSSSV